MSPIQAAGQSVIIDTLEQAYNDAHPNTVDTAYHIKKILEIVKCYFIYYSQFGPWAEVIYANSDSPIAINALKAKEWLNKNIDNPDSTMNCWFILETLYKPK
jgi:hypothetical protein